MTLSEAAEMALMERRGQKATEQAVGMILAAARATNEKIWDWHYMQEREPKWRRHEQAR